MLLKILNAIWAVPVLFLVRTIRPLFHLKLYMIDSHRIGAFIPQTFHLVNNYSKSARTLVIFGTYKVSNQYWLKISQQSKLPIYGWWVKYLFFWNKFLPSSEKFIADYGSYYNVFDKAKTKLDFTKFIDADFDTKTLGESWLKSYGWTHGEPFVCLMVRDSNYLNTFLPPKGIKNWNYHNYRDSDVNTYISAISWLIDQGYWVIRMGKAMKNRVNFQHDKFIDYSFINNQTDALDIWLFSKANFTISTGVGPDIVTPLCSNPILYINAIPINQAASFFKSIWVPKKLKWDNGKPFAINDYLNLSYSDSSKYAFNKIKIIDLSSIEILSFVKEFLSIYNNDFKLSEIELKEQFSFWQLFYSYEKNSKYSHLKHTKAFISPKWLENNRDY